MASSVNRVTLLGNLCKDPEVRNTQSGGKIVNLTVATSDTWNDKQSGERKERTEFHRVVIFNDRIASFVEQYIGKGRKVYIEGELRTRKWTDQSGTEKYSTEVVIDRFKGDLIPVDKRPDGGSSTSSLHPQPRPQPKPLGGTPAPDLDDEIPFAPFIF